MENYLSWWETILTALCARSTHVFDVWTNRACTHVREILGITEAFPLCSSHTVEPLTWGANIQGQLLRCICCLYSVYPTWLWLLAFIGFAHAMFPFALSFIFHFLAWSIWTDQRCKILCCCSRLTPVRPNIQWNMQSKTKGSIKINSADRTNCNYSLRALNLVGQVDWRKFQVQYFADPSKKLAICFVFSHMEYIVRSDLLARSGSMVCSVTPPKSDFPKSWLTTSSETPCEAEISGQKIGETLPTQCSQFNVAASFSSIERKRCITLFLVCTQYFFV